MRIDSSFQPDEAASPSPSRAEHGAQTSRIPGRILYGTSSALVSIVSGRVRAPVQIIVEDDHDALGQRPGPNDRFC